MKHIWICGLSTLILLTACGGSDDAGGSGGAGGGGGASGAGGSGGTVSTGCPGDTKAAVGQACAVEGKSCSDCNDPCVACTLLKCTGGKWEEVVVPPDPTQCTDSGSKDWCGGETNLLCKSDEFCDLPSNAQCGLVTNTGYCKPKPANCTDDCPGVCGCDGKQYCNECQAQSAGVDTDPLGTCGDAGAADAGDAGAGDAAADSANDATTD